MYRIFVHEILSVGGVFCRLYEGIWEERWISDYYWLEWRRRADGYGCSAKFSKEGTMRKSPLAPLFQSGEFYCRNDGEEQRAVGALRNSL
jgi:hypothetical protein